MPEPAVRPGSKPEPVTRLLIAVPFYRNERLVQTFAAGLRRCADELAALSAKVVFYNDSPDYPALGAALQSCAEDAREAISIDVRTNAENLGWVKTSNQAMREALDLGVDLVLFNSDTVMFPGALTEMMKAAALDPMIGFVNPRSNNATLASFPIGERFRIADPAPAYAAYQALAHHLPALTYAPTALGFALLIRHNILSEFGFFDEAYGKGYEEENDLVMRASRCGYRAALANRAFVWHQGEQSFEGDARKSIVEKQNSALLARRYPEYQGLVRSWFDSTDYRAEFLISQLAQSTEGKLRLAFDFSTFGVYHSGTQKAGLQILESASRHWRDRFELFVICQEAVFDFHQMARYGVQCCDPQEDDVFAVVFRVGQPFDWDTMRRLSLKAAIVGVFMLDTISIDCSHLRSEQTVHIWHDTIAHADFIIYNSAFTARQFALRFPGVALPPHKVSLHSLDFDDYRDDPAANETISEEIAALPDDYVLVFGNQYPHKAVGEIANRLAERFPGTQIVALGVTAEGLAVAGSPSGLRHPGAPRDDRLLHLPNLRGFRVGRLSDADINALQRKAKLIVMPSHYEGFGIPVVHALALGKVIVTRRIPSLVEISEALGSPSNLHFFDTTADLLRIIEAAPAWRDEPDRSPKGDADRAARDVRGMIEAALANASYARIQDRFRTMQTLFGIARMAPATPADFAAQRTSLLLERVLRKVFALPGMFTLARGVYRVLDTIRRR